jgi:hypothetical protein|tara:strand:+ start:3526 stop:3660 length:135 start_codon:yes stop_codon:yes gene_type:complete
MPTKKPAEPAEQLEEPKITEKKKPVIKLKANEKLTRQGNIITTH